MAGGDHAGGGGWHARMIPAGPLSTGGARASGRPPELRETPTHDCAIAPFNVRNRPFVTEFRPLVQ
jgi:hypothetical protein